jgi:16S rRNA processing protein RimM
VTCEILTDFPDRLTRLAVAELSDGSAKPRRAQVRSCRLRHSPGGQARRGRRAIFHFEGSDSISDAEKLVGLEVQIPLAERMQLPSGSYYVTDLIGCEVKGRDNTALGIVTDVQFTGEDVPGTPILVLESSRGEVLIPLAQEICVGIDVASRRIEVALPEGLADLNRNS